MQLKTQFLFQLGLIESASCYWVNRLDHNQNFRLTQWLKYPIEGGHLRLGAICSELGGEDGLALTVL